MTQEFQLQSLKMAQTALISNLSDIEVVLGLVEEQNRSWEEATSQTYMLWFHIDIHKTRS